MVDVKIAWAMFCEWWNETFHHVNYQKARDEWVDTDYVVRPKNDFR